MRRYSERDLEDLEEAVSTRGYGLLRERMTAILHDKDLELRKPNDSETTARLRSEIEALETCLKLPGLLKRDIAAKIARQEKQ